MNLLKFSLSILSLMLMDVTHSVEFTAAPRNGRSGLSPITSYSTFTETVIRTSYVSAICARLFNVSSACDVSTNQQPTVLTFDEDMDKINDHLLFQPTKTVGIETTIGVQKSIVSHRDATLESSKDDVIAESAARSAFVHHHLLKPLLFSAVKVSFVKFVTTTTTSVVVDVYTTKTAYVMDCTPSPFYLSICKNQK